MWQSNRSRSTGWHRPAVPPVRSASHPGEKISEQPSGKCGFAGTPFARVRCNATTSCSGDVASSTRQAFRLTDLRCFMLVLELSEERRISHRQFAVHLQADVGPPADPLAVVQVRVRGVAVARVRLVIAATRTEGARP